MSNRSKLSYKLLLPVVVLALASLACGISFPVDRLPGAQVPTPYAQGQPVQQVEPVATQPPLILPSDVKDEQSLLVALYARVNPSVVNITIYLQRNGFELPYAQGSGFVYDNQRHIVTNAHVVQGADQIDVTFSDGTTVPAKTVGIDLHADLAVISVEQMPDGVSPLPMGDMSQLAVGQTVVAIGNPFGYAGTLTKGIISALGREIPALTQFNIPQSIQTDAAINPGNSGGPLLNLQGQVIGVNAQIETSGSTAANSGVGFAIPVSVIQRTVPDLIKDGKTQWSRIGVSGNDLSATQAKAMHIDITRGAYIDSITEGGPAEKAGMHGSTGEDVVDGRSVKVGGDVIVAIDDQPVRSFDDLLVYTSLKTRPGQQVKLTILRGGKTIEVTVTVDARPDEPAPTQEPFFQEPFPFITPTP